MSALSRVVRSGVSRRWVQTVVIMLATAAAVTAGLLGIGLLVASNAPFDHAFAAQRGAHLTVLTDPAKATAAQLAASAEADGVAEASGPFAVAQVMVLPPPPPGSSEPPVGADGPVLTVAARTGPGTGVDQVTLVEGRWPGKPGEVLLAAGGDFRVAVGDTLTMGDGTNARDVTVVGLARSVSDTADAWMTPGGLAALPAMSSGYQMLYRLDDAGSASRVGDVRDAVTAALPDGAVTSARSWLVVKKEANGQTSLFVPVPADVRRSEPPPLRPDRRHGRGRRGRLDDPPHRHSQGARLHPVPGRAGVRRASAAACFGRGGAGCRGWQPGRGAVAGRHGGSLRHRRPDDRSLGGRRRARRCARGGHDHRIGRRGTRGAALGRGRARGRAYACRRPRTVRRAGQPRGFRCPGR